MPYTDKDLELMRAASRAETEAIKALGAKANINFKDTAMSSTSLSNGSWGNVATYATIIIIAAVLIACMFYYIKQQRQKAARIALLQEYIEQRQTDAESRGIVVDNKYQYQQTPELYTPFQPPSTNTTAINRRYPSANSTPIGIISALPDNLRPNLTDPNLLAIGSPSPLRIMGLQSCMARLNIHPSTPDSQSSDVYGRPGGTPGSTRRALNFDTPDTPTVSPVGAFYAETPGLQITSNPVNPVQRMLLSTMPRVSSPLVAFSSTASESPTSPSEDQATLTRDSSFDTPLTSYKKEIAKNLADSAAKNVLRRRKIATKQNGSDLEPSI